MMFLYALYEPFVKNLVGESLKAVKDKDLTELDRINVDLKEILQAYRNDFVKVYGREPNL